MARQRTTNNDQTRRMRISSRLLLLLAIPLVGLLAVTGYGVYLGATQSRDANALSERTDLALTTYALIDDLQAERAALIEDQATTPELRSNVEASETALAAEAAAIGGGIETTTTAALERVDAAQRVSANELGGRVALNAYSTAIDTLLDLSTMAIDPRGTIDGAPAETTNYLARAQAATAQERDLLVITGDEGKLDAASFQVLMSLASEQESYAALAAASASPALAIQIEGVGYSMSAADVIRRDVFTEDGARNYSTWIAGLDQRSAELSELQGAAEVEAVAAVDDLASSSRVLLLAAALAAVAILLISILLLRRAIRSIARPLQDLAAQAEDVARSRLPEAVKAQQHHGGEELHLPALRATGAAEVHEVAAAFNDVQDTALRLAGEQAALRVNQAEAMTNLGRRNQTLLARQLDFISSLETRETDPAFLEHLFKLDHLASRMRRNAESLLILAGSETPRRRRAPAEVSEVVRAAMSEVEEFERVRIGHLLDATLAGPAVIDLIHLLAELIENALGFSPPDTTVEIDGRSLGQGGYQFAVIDHGVGMSDVELVAANQRISGLDELEGMPTRYLGQYVVAKLATKTGAMVRLQSTSGGRGVTALVVLPSSAVMGEPDRSAVASPLPGSKASREQGPVPFAPGAGVSGTPTTASIPMPEQLAPAEPEPLVSEISSDSISWSPADVIDTDLSAMWESEPFTDERNGEHTIAEAAFEERLFGEPEPEPFESALPAAPAAPAPPTPSTPDLADQWSRFSMDADELETGVDETPTPPLPTAPPLSTAPPVPSAPPLPAAPPAPTSVPTQPDWSPAAAPAPAADTAPAPVSAEARPLGAGRAGGLSKRVPGASLAESRGSEATDAPVEEADRSADKVRSMLSSFQAGRYRGRETADPDTQIAPATHGGADSASQDGRSSQ